MRICKVFKVHSKHDYQYLTEDSEIRLYTSAVQEGNRKDSIIERVVLQMIKLFFAYSVSYFVSQCAIQAAYNERGYEAYGGEYILILFAFLAAYSVINQFFKYFRREKTWKRNT